MREHTYYVYILSSKGRRLYVGVTNDITRGVATHKAAADPKAFTARYKINRLVHFERFKYVSDAIRREEEIKGWLRVKKIALIVEHNPDWCDLSECWGKPIEPFDESKLRPPQKF
jgi:putative endonuclease